jgi:hypothetical protein
VLTAGAAGPIEVDAKIIFVDLDLDVLVKLRDTVNGREACVPAAL